jgi:hypothetical protein
MNEMTESLRALGPLGLPKKFEEWDREIGILEEEVLGKEEAVHA